MTRGVDTVIREEELQGKLESGERIRVYIGVDPSGPTIHLGHAVALRKLRILQDAGHEVILLVGDFTGRIGDPTDRSAMRVPLTHEQVLENAKSYREQAAKILRFDGDNPVKLMFNSEWHDHMTFKEVIEMAQLFTVQQLLERDMYVVRIKEGKPIGLHEFLYPLMQGYDSIALDVDMELGGSDQLFNMLAGRTMMQKMKNKNKIVMTVGLLTGTDGRKMSKSFNNYIGVADAPEDMYGKIMSMRDDLMRQYFELCTDVPFDVIADMEKQMGEGINPRDVKMRLAREIVTIYHSSAEAQKAERQFVKVFQKKEDPDQLEEVLIDNEDISIVDLVIRAGFARSKSEAKRVIEQRGIKIDHVVSSDLDAVITVPKQGLILQKGKIRRKKVSRADVSH